MLLIECPYCGTRPQVEFAARGEAHIVRPLDPEAVSDAEWADYVFVRDNPKGVRRERWLHVHGCRRWFNVVRDTVSDRILAVYECGSPPPDVSE